MLRLTGKYGQYDEIENYKYKITQIQIDFHEENKDHKLGDEVNIKNTCSCVAFSGCIAKFVFLYPDIIKEIKNYGVKDNLFLSSLRIYGTTKEGYSDALIYKNNRRSESIKIYYF